ncbi:hypothetical protein ALC57_08602 [Trachymyrmex cornetzi]|uniref:Uncharacterized protein n=1 Tax=Trachymyrmex cornetzi TaxID=471704 RepID=A0A151J765_9HYME|nr:hypothetical protein ALC57_08602 [Trachymyrmex cornetzi]
MQYLTDKQEFEISKVLFYPFINASSSDYNTIYTAEVTSAEKAVCLGMKTCFITFDQPLYMKARDILAATLISDETFIVIRLGGFHMLMSFMGCIGYIMEGSDINQVLSLIYTEKTVDHILYGHAYARAVRAHVLLQLALSRIIFKHLESEKDFTVLLGSNSDFFSKCNTLQTETVHVADILENNEFKQWAEIFEKRLREIENKGKTAKLWISYFRMVSIVKDFIVTEKMGDWALHLRCVELMIPYFHSAGHFPYAKSSQIYLQDMQELKQKMDPDSPLANLQKKCFTARRTDNFFAGIHTDQTIEQTFMKSMSVESGPFRRGATDSVVHQCHRAGEVNFFYVWSFD